MSILDIVEKENSNVLNIFDRLQKTKNHYISEREYLFNQLKNNLIIDGQLEDKLFYSNPAINSNLKNTVNSLKANQEQIIKLINKVSVLPCDRLGWLTQIEKIRNLFEQKIDQQAELFREVNQKIAA